MTHPYDVTAVLSTYNRCRLLPRALESILNQDAGEVRYEVIVVDNNSTDQTRQVVEEFLQRRPPGLTYCFEARQGVSHSRNAGIMKARAPIVAFVDDDVCVSKNWIAEIKRTFDQHPEVDCIGGPVLPEWEQDPPGWLTSEHWAPVALQDYGKEPLYVDRHNQICLLSANFAFRCEVFDRIGLFAPKLQRVKDGIGSMEDLELLIRFWRAEGVALYTPSLVVLAQIPADRMKKTYHRRWHTGHGRFYAMLRDEEMEQSAEGRFFDVPAHLYGQALRNAWLFMKSTLLLRNAAAFLYETKLRFFLGFFRERKAEFQASRRVSVTAEIASVARLIASRMR